LRDIRIGAGAGFSGDRIEPAVELAEQGNLDYLVFECLAERTIALAQQARLRDRAGGFDPLLDARMRAVLPSCRRNAVRIVTNMGAANPMAAAERVRDIAEDLGLSGLKVAAVLGDDVLDIVTSGDWTLDDTGAPVSTLGNALVSANAYLGAEPIVAALEQGADVVITGRVADPALFMAPMIHEFGWPMDDWKRLGSGTLAGHLLECAGQITGGYFADPGYKDVPDLARLGFPIGIVGEDGSLVVTKVEGSGGLVSEATVKEQMLYEVHDPAAYRQPDVVADFSFVRVSGDGDNRVQVQGAQGHPKSGLLKVSVGRIDSFSGEGQISYAGPGALERGRLAGEIVRERLAMTGVDCRDLRCELIGVDSILGPALSTGTPAPREVRLRVIARTGSAAEAARIGQEVESLYLNGPAGGGGAIKSVREIIAISSILIPEELVKTDVRMLEVAS
jgi:hypothetical protein